MFLWVWVTKWTFVCFCESAWSFCESECETKWNFVFFCESEYETKVEFFRFFDSECEAKWNFVCFCESECETKWKFMFLWVWAEFLYFFVSLSVRQSWILYVCVSMSVRQSGIVRFVLVNSLKSGDS